MYGTWWSGVALVLAILGTKLSTSTWYLLQPLPSNTKVKTLKDSYIASAIQAPLPLEAYANITDRELLTDPTSCVKLYKGEILGPESVYVDSDANIYILDAFGNLYRTALTESTLEFVRYIGPGRPLGFHGTTTADGEHVLIIADSLKGLLQVSLDDPKDLRILTNSYQTNADPSLMVPFTYANDLDISANNSVIYFSASGTIPPALNRQGFYDTMASYILISLSGEAKGKLLAYDMDTKETKLLVDELMFANGVALSADASFVAVVDTTMRCIKRHWLTGENKGKTEYLIQNLPGFPDGITRASDGTFWVALIFPDSNLSRSLLGLPRQIRWILSWLLQSSIIRPFPKKMGLVINISPIDGHIIQILQDPKGENIFGISGLYEHQNHLFFGHLSQDYISMVSLSQK